MMSQLTLTPLLERAGTLFPTRRRSSPGVRTIRYTIRHTATPTARCTRARGRWRPRSSEMGLRPGDRVATLMWNHYMHLEAYFAVPVIGGILHTLNLRLHHDELAYIVNHAEDRFLIVDDVLLPVYQAFAGKVTIERVIVTRFGGDGAGGGRAGRAARLR